MPWDNLRATGNIVEHKSSKNEINALFSLIERDLKDAGVKELSTDRRFATAYNAALQTATVIMHCLGFRARSGAHHFTSFRFLREAEGGKFSGLADYFNACRVKRNITDYDRAGEISEKEAQELLDEADKFYQKTVNWIKKTHPRYL